MNKTTMGILDEADKPAFCKDCGKPVDLKEHEICPECKGELEETWKDECPTCEEEHYHRPNNHCRCCKQRSVEIGIHYPVLCYGCSKKLNEIRSRLNPCPNCGQGAGGDPESEGYLCRNSNCRVQYFESEGDDKVYEKIREERGIEVPQ